MYCHRFNNYKFVRIQIILKVLTFRNSFNGIIWCSISNQSHKKNRNSTKIEIITKLKNHVYCSRVSWHLAQGVPSCKFFKSFVSDTMLYLQIQQTSILYTSEFEILKAEFRNVFMVTVELQSSRRKRSTQSTTTPEGYEISLSNDGIHFGENFSIIIYDEDCYSCNSTSVSCIVSVRFFCIQGHIASSLQNFAFRTIQ